MRVAAAFAATNNFGALKLEAKLLKQQLFCSCFWYTTVEASDWNWAWIFFLCSANSNRKCNQYLFVWPWIYLSYSLLKNSGSLVIKLSSIQSVSRSKQCRDLADCPWNWYISSESLGRRVFFNLLLLHLDASCLCIWQKHSPFRYYPLFDRSQHKLFFLCLIPTIPLKTWS